MVRRVCFGLFITTAILLLGGWGDQQEAGYEDYLIILEDGGDAEVIEDTGGVVTEHFTALDIVSASLTNQQVKALQQEVDFIEPDLTVRLDSQQTGYGLPMILSRRIWHEAYPKAGITGKGIRIGVIDSGIASDHPDLSVAGGVSFVHDTDSFEDDNGHGTHVAGIIGALDNELGIRGVAPEAELFAIKVFRSNGLGQISSVISALDWAIEHELDIVNLSLSTPTDSSALRLAVEKADRAGIIMITSAGNTGADSPRYPSAYPQTIAVGAIGSDLLAADFSTTGGAVDLVAPGVSIHSTYLSHSYIHMSGTSMAAPHVTGVAALFKQLDPDASPTVIREQLFDQAVDLGEPGRDPIYGEGMVQGFDVLTQSLPDIIQLEGVENVDGVSGQHAELSLYTVFDDGSRIEVTPHAVWSSSDPSIAMFYQGRVYFNHKGSALITAGFEGHSYTIAVNVTDDLKEIAAPVLTFSDTPPEHWAYEPIMSLVSDKVINGYGDGTFRPDQPIRRDHVALLLSKSVHLQPVLPLRRFVDIPETNSYYPVIMQLQQAGVFHGQNGYFHPHSLLTRAQMAKILVEAFDLSGSIRHPFSDVPSGHWAENYISILHENGITEGSAGRYKPEAPVTRAEYAVFLWRLTGE
ncbi:S8 family serine peptidase [Jeotgalibacillus sp. JSM ZJ347]|uniref:S8 family peptidase n=1 Tax=Jeotgalibacillus sp. JSM ZJ347 TaxID=3342117 RepID=UPI0035A84ECE